MQTLLEILTFSWLKEKTNSQSDLAIAEIGNHAEQMGTGTENVLPDYTAAIEKFKEFKTSYPADPRTAEADSWIRILGKLQTLKKMGLEDE